MVRISLPGRRIGARAVAVALTDLVMPSPSKDGSTQVPNDTASSYTEDLTVPARNRISHLVGGARCVPDNWRASRAKPG